jgi:hypothetical protein
MAQEVRERYMRDHECTDVKELAILRRLSRVSYSRKCAGASAVKAYQKQGLHLVPGVEIGYVVADAAKWKVDTERDASEFDEDIMGSCWTRRGRGILRYSECPLLVKACGSPIPRTYNFFRQYFWYLLEEKYQFYCLHCNKCQTLALQESLRQRLSPFRPHHQPHRRQPRSSCPEEKGGLGSPPVPEGARQEAGAYGDKAQRT